jgi:ELWxxDGT repeat protein
MGRRLAAVQNRLVILNARVIAIVALAFAPSTALAANPLVRLVKDINTGTANANPAGDSPYRARITIDGLLYFVATDAAHGTELWKTDGTPAGTVLLKDINPGTGSSSPNSLTNFNGTLYFTANDGTTGQELWKSDGSADGTVLVEGIRAGLNSAFRSFGNSLAVVGSSLFLTANDGAIGYELWKSDGSAAGTILVKDVNPAAASGDPFFMTNVDGTLFFVATEGTTGSELWRSDGTAAEHFSSRISIPAPCRRCLRTSSR